MIADGHFKEMKDILNYIYTKRVEFKKNKVVPDGTLQTIPKDSSQVPLEHKQKILKEGKNMMKDLETQENFYLGRNLEQSTKNKGIIEMKDV
jgi:hypothetical protein